MERRITVKGTGQISLKPDLIVITVGLDSLDLDYERAMGLATQSLDELHQLMGKAGFNKEDLKTTNFNVSTQYRGEQDQKGQYIQIFEGYVVHHELKLEFDMDQDRLTRTLSAIAAAKATPKLDIRFSIKDQTKAMEELLTKATEAAKKKAQVLAKASGVTLGDLITIDYNWGEQTPYSRTTYAMEDTRMMKSASLAPNIEPEDISLSDAVTFVWALV